MEMQKVTITNKNGLHARPAYTFVQEASKFKSKITLKRDAKTASGKSIINIISLGCTQGTEITISAEGEDEKEAVATLVSLVRSGIGE